MGWCYRDHWLFAWWHQAITRTIVDFSSVRFCGIPAWAISQQTTMLYHNFFFFLNFCHNSRVVLGIGFENQDGSLVHHFDELIGSDQKVTNIITHPIIRIFLAFICSLISSELLEKTYISVKWLILSVVYLEVWDLKFKPVTSNLCAKEFPISAKYVKINNFT